MSRLRWPSTCAASRTIARIGLLALGMAALAGCVSSDIVLEANVPAPAAPPSAAAPAVTVETVVAQPPAAKHEEPGDKTLIGRSESLGVHLSDIWMREAPAAFAGRLVEASIARWGYRVASSGASLKLRVRAESDTALRTSLRQALLP